MGNNNLQQDEKYCVVRIGSSWFAIPALAVREIRTSDHVVPVPKSHAILAGLCHLGNEFLPVLRWFDQAAHEPSACGPDTQLVVVTGLSGDWAFAVDEVAGLASLDVSVDADTRSSDGWLAAVLGSATYRDKVVRLLDTNRLYRFAEREVRQRWVAADATREAVHAGNRSQGENW
jgi:chemotaxis signal transduction protein